MTSPTTHGRWLAPAVVGVGALVVVTLVVRSVISAAFVVGSMDEATAVRVSVASLIVGAVLGVVGGVLAAYFAVRRLPTPYAVAVVVIVSAPLTLVATGVLYGTLGCLGWL